MMRAFYLLFIIFLGACSSSENNETQATQNGGAKEIFEAKKELRDSLSIFKAQYLNMFNVQVAKSSNASIKTDLQVFDSVFMNTSAFIDSIWFYVDTMDYQTASGVYLMGSRFVDEGLGDTLYKKINAVFKYARKVAPPDAYPLIEAQHADIFNNADAEGWKRRYFGQINPLGVSILLYGFQSALYKVGHYAYSG